MTLTLFFQPRQCLFGPCPRLFIIPNIFLLTCSEIDDLNANIPLLKF